MPIQTPIKNIGCQELIEKVKEHGHLRRRTKLNCFLNKFIPINWSQNYVLIYNGCIYCYAVETNAYYSKARSLYGFDNCCECTLEECTKNNLWVFKANNRLNPKKSFFFAAVSENEMKKWIESINQEIDSVNNGTLQRLPTLPIPIKERDSNNSDDSDSNYEEVGESLRGSVSNSICSTELSPRTGRDHQKTPIKPLPIPPLNSLRSPPPIPPKPSTIAKSSSHEKPSNLPKPMPPLKNRTIATTASNTFLNNRTLTTTASNTFPNTKPTSVVKPMRPSDLKKPGQVTTPIVYELNEPKGFWDGEPEEPENFLSAKIPGTFLIRKSNSTDHPLTLLVKSEIDPIKKYQIFKTNDKYHIEKKSREEEKFVQVDHLISYYQKYNLPSKQGPIILGKPFNHNS